MPGLFGFVNEIDEVKAKARLKQMAYLLEPEERFQADFHVEAGIALGRVSLGILNPQPQPMWNHDRSVCIFMEGEQFNRESLEREAGDRLHDSSRHDDITLALALYEKFGKHFVGMLNGAFIISIWDRSAQELIIANDRLGLYPIYFSKAPGGFQFASGVRALLVDPGLSREVDRTALAEFLTFDHVLRQRTILRDVELFPQATILTFRSGECAMEQYWAPASMQPDGTFDHEEYLEEFTELLKQAVRRQIACDDSPSLLLSGGLDSRALLGAMAEVKPEADLRTFTWGTDGCDEVRFAREASRKVGARHHFNLLRNDWLLSLGETGSRITDGTGNLVNLHALAVIEEQSHNARILYKGFLGDAMFGFGLRPRYWGVYDADTHAQVHFEAYRDYDVLVFDFPEHEKLFSDPFLQAVDGTILDDYQLVMRSSGMEDLAGQRIYIDLTQRVPRMTVHGVESVRHRAAARLPYCDYDLLDFSLRIPPGLLIDRVMVVQAFIRAFPQLAQIPFTPQLLPLMNCARDVVERAAMVARWHLSRVGLGGILGPPSNPCRDYASWFRTVLRSWVEEVLLSPRCLERGYYRPEYVQGMVHKHMMGENHAVRIGAMLSIELWHRAYLD
jgi:asparagine synthase (glutamine-hydrolysing)